MASIQGIYIALFGRPADPRGFAYFLQVTKDGQDLTAIGNLSGSEEYQSRFKGMTIPEVISAIYDSLFDRAPEPAGLAFWAGAMVSGRFDINTISIAILDGAAGKDKETLAAKLAIADAFTAALDTPDEIAAYAGTTAAAKIQAYLSGITWDKPGSPSDIDAIIRELLGPVPGDGGPTGLNVNLTMDDDHIVGTSVADTISGSFDGNNTTFGPNDTVNGGGGIDTFRLSINGTVPITAGQLTSVERIVVTNLMGSNLTTFGLTSVSGITDVISESSVDTSVLYLLTTHAVRMTLRDTNTAMVFKVDDLSAANDKLDLVVDHAGTNGTHATFAGDPNQTDAYESISLRTSGSASNYLDLESISVVANATMSITGAADLYLKFVTAPTIASINAAAASGAVSVDISTYIQGTTPVVTFGSGNDTLIASALTGLSANGGAGTDRVSVVAGTNISGFTNFEILRISEGGGSFTQNVGNFTAIEMKASSSANQYGYLVGVKNNSTIELSGTYTYLHATLADQSGTSDTLTLRLNGVNSATSLDYVSGLEKLNIEVIDGTSNGFGVASTAKLIITGAGDLALGAIASDIDASGLTGHFNLNALDTSNHNIVLGSGAGTVALGTGDDTIALGKAGSNAQSGADIINTSSGLDTVVFVGSNNLVTGTSTDYDKLATVGAFSIADGKLGFSAHNADFRTLAPGANEQTAVYGLAKGTTVKGLLSGDTMVVQDVDDTQGSIQAVSNVSFLKFTESVTLSTMTDVASAMAAAINGTLIQGLAQGGNYLASYYDSGSNAAILAVVNTGNDTQLTVSDFTGAGVSLIGTIQMSSTDYANFGAANLVAI